MAFGRLEAKTQFNDKTKSGLARLHPSDGWGQLNCQGWHFRSCHASTS